MKRKYRAVQYRFKGPWIIQSRSFGLWFNRGTAHTFKDISYVISNVKDADEFKVQVVYEGDSLPASLKGK